MSADAHPHYGLDHSSAQIVQVACTMMAERGFAGMSMRVLAQRVGLQAGSLYHHFPSKQDLLEEVVARLQAQRLSAWLSHKSKSRDPRIMLAEFVTFQVRRQLHAEAEERVLGMEICHLTDAQRPEIQRGQDRYVAELESILLSGQRVRRFRSGNVLLLAHGILGLCGGAASMHQCCGIPERQLVEQIKAMAERLSAAAL
jgi:AcrR family transcriptional regulator